MTLAQPFAYFQAISRCAGHAITGLSLSCIPNAPVPSRLPKLKDGMSVSCFCVHTSVMLGIRDEGHCQRADFDKRNPKSPLPLGCVPAVRNPCALGIDSRGVPHRSSAGAGMRAEAVMLEVRDQKLVTACNTIP
eukprot:scaffold19018_cov19-Tisochrysis_lutea.AAC.2